jgi:hypothetical protein
MKKALLIWGCFFWISLPCIAQKIVLKKDLTIKPKEAGFFYDIAVDKKGNIYASDIIAGNIKDYTPEGKLKGVIGRRGKGPGEFLVPKNLAVINSSLYVYDDRLIKISIFKLGKDVNIQKSISLKETQFGVPHKILFDTPNLFFGIYSKGYSSKNLNDNHYAILNLINNKGKLIKRSVLKVPAKEYLAYREGSGFTVAPKPFGRKPVFETGKNHTFYYGNTNKLAIKKYCMNGKILRRYEADVRKVDIANSDLKKLSKKPRYTSKDIREFRRGHTKTFPAFSWFVVDGKSRIWVAVNTKNRKSYSLFIFGNNRKLLDKTPLSKSVEIKVIKDGHAYGIKTGKEGIQSLVRYKIKELK